MAEKQQPAKTDQDPPSAWAAQRLTIEIVYNSLLVSDWLVPDSAHFPRCRVVSLTQIIYAASADRRRVRG